MIANYNELLSQIGAVFVIGNRVRHVTQEEGRPGVITAIMIAPGAIRYGVIFDPTEGELWCSAIELEPAEEDSWY